QRFFRKGSGPGRPGGRPDHDALRPAQVARKQSLANMARVRRAVELNQEAVRIPKFERLVRSAGLNLQIACLQFRQNRVRIKSRDSEIEVIELRRCALLLDTEEALSDAQNVDVFRVLLERHPE